MTDRQETIADIIAEMKREAAQIFSALPIAVLQLATRLEAACLEAAWKRERELTKPAENVNSCAASDTAGNCAKLRVALETLRELLGDLLRLEEAEYHNDFLNFCDIIDAAISAPPRNCDLYDSYGDAIRAFEDDENAENYEEMAEWLFAPATETEGGAK